MYSLSYLIDRSVLKRIKDAGDFKERVKILDEYYVDIVNQHQSILHYVNIVSRILDDFAGKSGVNIKVEDVASKYKIDIRTLQRYFSKTIGISPKKALLLMRIRKALSHLCDDPSTFKITSYGYFDHSHFYKDVKNFVSMPDPEVSRSYLILLNKISGRYVV
jgi:transcriptional regulator GlxA family with amidase domain